METSKSRTEDEKQEAAKAEYEKLLTMRSGGTYIPPARLRALQSQITDKSSKAYQRMAWEALKKSINGLINKVNVSNIKHIVPELFGENLIRGRGLFCRSIMKAQASSLPFTPIYAAMAAIVNTKLPMVGELLLKRLIVQFKKGFKRNDKAVCLSATTFIAHLCNQQVANEVVAAQILLLLLHRPTDDSVEIAVGLTREVGQHLEDMNQVIALAVFDQFRNILHEADIDKRVQYMIEVLFQVRKDKYKDNPAIKEELDLVEEEDQITHVISLDDAIDVSEHLNIFKFDPDWEANEEQYNRTKSEIFGEVSDNDEEDDGEDEEDESEDSGDEEEKDKVLEIRDQSNADLVALRKTIYLTIMSSIDPEECCHKLMKVQLPGGMEAELPSMIVECCSQEKTYSKFYGLVGEKFAKINRLWAQLFEEAFSKYFDTIHRYETNRLRNIARFFGHLLSSDGIGWHVISIIHLNEEETTASSRIFIKILFEDLVEAMGMPKLQARLKDDACRPHCEGIFPRDNQRNIRFSINYFTSIKMGPLTEEMREYLANLPKQSLPAPTAAADDSGSDSSSVSSYSSYTGSSYSKSPSPVRDLSVERRRSPSRDSRTRHSRGRSLTSSMSRSITPARHHDRYSRSISPPRRGRPGSSQSRSSRARDRLKYNSISPPRHRHVRESRSRTRSISRSLTPERRYRRYSSSVSPPRLSHRKSSFSRSPQTRGRAPRRTNDYAVSTSRRRSNSRRSHRSPSRNLKSLPRRRQSRSPRPRAFKKYDRSVTPPRRGRTRTPPRRGRRYSSYSDSRSPPSKKRRRRSSDSRSPPRRNLRRDSRSVSPPRRSLRRDSTSSSPPAKKRRNLSNSRSPPPRRAADSR